ncbi:MAG: hypothetical protein EKK55_05550 [Rhodocyclaceae bacterium]|nr:MAG: hypothetical protein EKK55_05550 [Rhodocyclaceae bacterium]
MTYRLNMLPADDRAEVQLRLGEPRADCACKSGRCTLDSLEREAFEVEVVRLWHRDRGRDVTAPIKAYVALALKGMTVDDNGTHRVGP